MTYATLGTTDLQVSKICLGTMTFGQQNTEADGHAQMDYARSQGINFFDTAEMYSIPPRPETQGSTERIIGTWLKSRGGRDKIVLATKIVGPNPNFTHIRNPLHINREQILQAIEGSLQRLQTDYVDLYQIHWPERNTNFFGKLNYEYDLNDPWEDNFPEILETMGELVQAGKIRHFGVSNETAWGVMRFLQISEKHGLPRCQSIQNPYSLINRMFEINLSEITHRERVGLLAYSPLGFGKLTGKYHHGTAAPDSRLNQFKQYTRYNSPEATEAIARYVELAKAHDISPAQLALAFVNTRPFVTSNIIGATTLAQLQENIDSLKITLSAEVLKEIEAIHKKIPNPAP
jgi:aryl-alcohol dehydrogenase-like predicted oxidoreductase